MNKHFEVLFTKHAFERFIQRFSKKNLTKKEYSIEILKILEQFKTDPNSYVEVIENVDNNKKRHQKFVDRRKKENNTNKFLHKDTQLIFIFNTENNVLISVRKDTGKFKRRRTQHEFKITPREVFVDEDKEESKNFFSEEQLEQT